MENNFIDHGQGLMTIEEHNNLVNMGIMKCFGDNDIIVNDGFCVNVFKNDEPTCVFEGDKFSCEMEADKIRTEKKGVKVRVMPYPKGYIKYYKLDENQFREEI